MSAAEAMSAQNDQTATFSLLPTDPDKPVEIATYTQYSDNRPTNTVFSYKEFFDSLSRPDGSLTQKDGPSFLIGPCHGRRLGSNIQKAYLAVLDADSSVGEDGLPVEGAPPPAQVHAAFKEWGISHHIYTTFSHLEKGNRYRVVFPVELSCQAELYGFLIYLSSILQEHAKIPIHLTRESYTWGQGWAMPRVREEGWPFYSETFWGSVPDPSYLAQLYPVNSHGSAGPQLLKVPSVADDKSSGSLLMKLFAEYYPLQTLLSDHGYEFVSQSIMLNDSGQDLPVYRFRKPGSGSAPGVVVFWSEDRWRCYSHHRNDVLATGFAVDSFDAFVSLNNLSNRAEAIKLAVDIIHEGLAAEMNLSYPSVMVGGSKYRIVNRTHDDFMNENVAFMAPADFVQHQSNLPPVPITTTDEDGKIGIKYVSRSEFWSKCQKRIRFDGDTFIPSRLGSSYEPIIERYGKSYYNLFRGWQVQPVEGDWSLIDWHIKNVLCSGDQSQYDYFLDWVAHLIQFPNEKPDVAVVMRGAKGVGKSLLAGKLAKALGSAGLVFSGNQLLTGRFSGHMRNKLLLVLEESFWAGNKQDEARLKHLISDEQTTFESKGVDAQAGRSLARVIMITNNDWSAPVSSDERRYFIPTISEAGRNRDRIEGNYFSNLSKSLDGGGLSAFLYAMLNRATSRNRLRDVPSTAELRRQQELSMEGMDAWMFDSLKMGSFMADRIAVPITEMQTVVSGADLLESSRRYLGPYFASRSFHTKISQYFSDTFGKLATPINVNGLTGYSYQLAALSKLKEKFAERLGYKPDW